MYSFKNDYSDGGHPLVIEALARTASVQAEGYGMDRFSEEARELLRQKMDAPHGDIHFLPGGTQSNLLALSSFLRPHEAVISAVTGHIFVHETGAVEATGHKVLSVNGKEGKVHPEQVRAVVREHHFEHMVKPRLVYLSQSTEIGTIYGRKEICALREVCDELGLLLYMDGARLGSALMAEGNDLHLSDLKDYCDAFYIGGTKNGALYGEALVICKDALKSDFRYLMKQRGALLAKGRLLALQFKALFEDDLYFTLASQANEKAARIQKAVLDLGYRVKFHSRTNQIFPVFPEAVLRELEKAFSFYRWETAGGEEYVVRLICSWASDDSQVEAFIRELTRITEQNGHSGS